MALETTQFQFGFVFFQIVCSPKMDCNVDAHIVCVLTWNKFLRWGDEVEHLPHTTRGGVGVGGYGIISIIFLFELS